MERLLVIRRELKAEWAKEQYDRAMSEFQAECPIIKKTKGVRTDEGKVAYKYAPLEAIVDQVKELLSKHGFSYGVNQPESKQGYIKVAFTVKHKSGHSEVSSVELPLGNKTRIMSQTQVEAAALTFAKRYAFCNAFGILTGDEDTDANSDTQNSSPSTQPAPQKSATYLLTYQQQKAIFGMLNQKGYSKDQLDSSVERRWKKDSISKLTVLEAEVLIAKIKSLDPSEAMEEIDVEEAERGIKKMNGQRASL
jgi:hypothetical protein